MFGQATSATILMVMLEKSVSFRRVVFPPEVILEAVGALVEAARHEDIEPVDQRLGYQAETLTAHFDSLSISNGSTSWTYDNEAEFFADLRRPHESAFVSVGVPPQRTNFYLSEGEYETYVKVAASKRHLVEQIMAPFERDPDKYRSAPEEPSVTPRIFIGHGGNQAWHELSAFLHHQMGYEVEAYETLPRAGHDIERVLRDMLDRTNFALLVMTAEDAQAEGEFRARQNVIHEIGLWQGRIGWDRAIVLLEHGTEDFSNLAGVQQLRFEPGQIRSVTGDVLATLRREFPA